MKLTALLILAALTAGAGLLASGASRPREATGSSKAPPEPVAAADVFRVFGPSHAASTAPAARRAATALDGVVTVDPSMVRDLARTPEANVVGLAARDSVCLHVEQASMGADGRGWGGDACANLRDPEVAERPMTSVTFIGGGRWQFSALVPDGIDALHLRTAAGERVLRVRDNAVAADLAGKPGTVSWTAPGGERRTAETWSDG